MTPSGQSAYAATDGAAYQRFIGRWTRRLADPLIAFAGPLPEGPILDVGTGTGSVVAALRQAEPGRDVTGIDVAEPYLAYARVQDGCTGATFLQQDAATLDLPGDSFAGASSCIVMNFLKEPAKALSEMRRVVMPGGVIASAVWDFRGGLVYQRILWDTIASLDPEAAATRDRIFSAPLGLPDGMVNLWREAGLEGVTRTSLTIRMDFSNFADYWEPLLGGQGPVGGYVAGLEPDMQTRVREAVRAAFLAGAADGERSLTATAWAVKGRVTA
ncbi:MAG: class I SAM-dependent methyltransferase [Alphaproteobacteria bacterium]|nr:class I SAM-dependent methyltransferase [Alphaproteobacteria bacterium]